ncbi:DUF11 domain-containing protein [Microbacterium sp. MYb62]|uniref:DUF11 domain-containing protein n=1 Tax=Microbacterium sp. MYb62 TaxID=1848690 RepID=UPI0015E3FA50|nr:DUF11 domain-containing protein [Microbacterium sp. MYb62]
MAAVLFPAPASASEGAPFLNADGSACNGRALLMKEQAPADRGIISLDLAAGAQSPNTPTANGYAFNSAGYNPEDGHLYGTYRMETGGPGAGPAPAATNGTIWRIAADGTYEQVELSGPGVVAPTPANNNLGSLPFLNAPSYPIGDFDEDGHYWVAARTSDGGTHTGPLYEIAITPGTATTRPTGVVVSMIDPQQDVGESDFTYIPGTDSFWSVTDAPGSHLVAINRSGVVTGYGVVANLPVAQYIGMYADANANIYAVRIGTGDVYAINRTAAVDGGEPLAATLVSNIGPIGNGDAAQCGAIQPLPALRFGKVVDQAQSMSGGVLTYTLTVQNVGLVDLTDVPVHDALGAGATYVDGTARLDGVPTGTYAGPAPGTIDWTIPSLARGATATMTFQVTVDPGVQPHTIVNRMSTEYPPGEVPPGTPPPAVDHPCEDDPTRSCAITEIPGTPTITFGKTVDRVTAAIGDTLTYTVRVANTGGADAANVAVTDALPDGVTFVSADNGGIGLDDVVSWTIPSLTAGSSVDLHITATIDATASAGTVTNRVIVTPPPGTPPATVEYPCADDATRSCASTEIPPTPDVPTKPKKGGSTSLASTGAEASPLWALSGAGLLALGTLLLIGLRRRA